jgi:hypothetical protein
MIGDDTAAGTPDHWAVPLHQRRDRGGIPLLDEAPQQLPICQLGFLRPKDDPTKVLNDLADLGRHLVPFSARGNARPLQSIHYPHDADLMRYFPTAGGRT